MDLLHFLHYSRIFGFLFKPKCKFYLFNPFMDFVPKNIVCCYMFTVIYNNFRIIIPITPVAVVIFVVIVAIVAFMVLCRLVAAAVVVVVALFDAGISILYGRHRPRRSWNTRRHGFTQIPVRQKIQHIFDIDTLGNWGGGRGQGQSLGNNDSFYKIQNIFWFCFFISIIIYN